MQEEGKNQRRFKRGREVFWEAPPNYFHLRLPFQKLDIWTQLAAREARKHRVLTECAAAGNETKTLLRRSMAVLVLEK